MPALAKPPAVLPLVPQIRPGATAGTGLFSDPVSKAASKEHTVTLGSEHIERLAHDARNVLAGLTLYCDLLAAPGVLARQHTHYAQELEGLVGNATQIIERLAEAHHAKTNLLAEGPPTRAPLSLASQPSVPVTDLAEVLCHLQPLLAAIAGPAIQLSIATMPCRGRTALALEDLTRILVNLVRNASDAMPARGRIRITAQYGDGLSFLATEPQHTPAWRSSRCFRQRPWNPGDSARAGLRKRLHHTHGNTENRGPLAGSAPPRPRTQHRTQSG